jgi:ubiquinone/menaquinone biosynthesis C-methylase UbiE
MLEPGDTVPDRPDSATGTGATAFPTSRVTWDAKLWDERYSSADRLWSAEPNRWVEQELANLAPGDALDLACGEGRNAVWLAERRWRVTAVDFSRVALDRGRAAARERGLSVTWIEADLLAWRPDANSADLVLLCYLQLTVAEMSQVLDTASTALRAGGTLLLVGHDVRNITEGTGGPQDPSVLYSAREIGDALARHVTVLRAETVRRPVAGAPRDALDALVRATR